MLLDEIFYNHFSKWTQADFLQPHNFPFTNDIKEEVAFLQTTDFMWRLELEPLSLVTRPTAFPTVKHKDDEFWRFACMAKSLA